MIIVECPYCNMNNDILFSGEMATVTRVGRAVRKCNRCKKDFEVFCGDTMLETRKLKEYRYAGDMSFESAYHDCKIVDESITDEKSFQKCDSGLVLYCMKRILEALEKQIPKKVVLKDDEFYSCPSCGVQDHNNPRENGRYCKHCGQRLGWRE